MAEQIRSVQPFELYRRFLEKDVRPDGRGLGDFRDVVLNIGGNNGSCISTAEGSALIRQGHTTIVCGIKADLGEPKAETPKAGYIVPNVELSPLCSSQFRPGPPGEQAQTLSQFIANVVTYSRCLPLEDLCISEGKLVWVLYIDMICLDYDGNLADACIMALTAALTNTFLPEVKVDEETGRVGVDLDKKIKLLLSCRPISLTTAIFDDTILLVDPTRHEEEVATGFITVITDGTDICCIDKPGGSPVRDDQMNQCIERAFQHHRDACRIIDATYTSLSPNLADR